jgi:hypothetical protein
LAIGAALAVVAVVALVAVTADSAAGTTPSFARLIVRQVNAKPTAPVERLDGVEFRRHLDLSGSGAVQAVGVSRDSRVR